MRLLVIFIILFSLIGCSTKHVSPSDGIKISFKSTTINKSHQGLFLFKNDYDCKGLIHVQKTGNNDLDLTFKISSREFSTIYYGYGARQGIYTFKVDETKEYSFTTDGHYLVAEERPSKSNGKWKPVISFTERHLTRPGFQSGSWCKPDEAFKDVLER